MEQLDAASMIFLVSLLTQFVKKHWTPSEKYSQLVALGFSFVLILPFYLIPALKSSVNLPTLDAVWNVFQSVVWMLFGWLASIGVYEVGVKRLGSK